MLTTAIADNGDRRAASQRYRPCSASASGRARTASRAIWQLRRSVRESACRARCDDGIAGRNGANRADEVFGESIHTTATATFALNRCRRAAVDDSTSEAEPLQPAGD